MVKVFARIKDGKILDNNHGGVPIILGYVENVNTLVPTEDVDTFLDRFHK